MSNIGKTLASNASDLRPDAPNPGSAQWKAEREAEEMRGERRQGRDEGLLAEESADEEDLEEKQRKLSIDLDPGMNS